MQYTLEYRLTHTAICILSVLLFQQIPAIGDPPPRTDLSGERERTSNSDAIGTREGSLWEQRWYREWLPEEFFDDPEVVDLCKAIGEGDYRRIHRLIESEGVDVNARGYRDMTPLFWAFPLAQAEIVLNLPRDEQGRWIDDAALNSECQQRIFDKHARMLECLLKLGANPNLRLSRFEQPTKDSVPVLLFGLAKGLAVTHLATRPYGIARYNFFPMVMANGGDANLVYEERGVPPLFLVCASGIYFPSTHGPPGKTFPENLALLIDAKVDLEFRDPQGTSLHPEGNTPILAAAEAQHFDLVHMLIHAGAAFRATNERGWGLPKYAPALRVRSRRTSWTSCGSWKTRAWSLKGPTQTTRRRLTEWSRNPKTLCMLSATRSSTNGSRSEGNCRKQTKRFRLRSL